MKKAPFHAGVSQPRFFWRGVLILLPLALLAGVGIYSLRQDQLLVEVEARERCQGVAEYYARTIAAELQKPAPQSFSKISLDAGGNLAAIGGSRSRASMMENVVPHPLLETALTPDQREAWKSARFKKFIESGPPAIFLTHARYALALQCAVSNQAAADDLLREVEQDRAAFTESGLPLFLLAQYQRWKLDGPRGDSGTLLCSNAVEFPTLISPMLLAADPADNPKWLADWQWDEDARQFYQNVKPRLTTRPLQPSCFWTDWQERTWLVVVLPAKGGFMLSTPFISRFFVLPVDTSEPEAYPQQSIPYAQARVVVAGKAAYGADHPKLPLAEAGAELFPGTTLTVSEYLARPDLLYARARTRTWWFGALILVSAAAALIGFVSAYRGFRQQIRLGEMKSNFVASVSHELRAPIASMRLLAESLERGKIAEAAKQKQYFGLLVQEARRLSTLIENILDFSRIERGAKTYEFEAADMAALVEDTVQRMRPCALARQVELDLHNGRGDGVEFFDCDGLALQQALINLIDNAVKHSPPGARVAVGVEGGQAGLSLWVEDHGPGIPAEEHGRIFERFYRRGSELRRETQGIGIGLTIVKHIAEAHGGRVTVRSAPGRGSRFTLELPRR